MQPEAPEQGLLARLTLGQVPDGPFIGIEQEFEVWRGSDRIDFRELIHGLPIDGLRLDPGDTNAYRLRSGMALTCDEAEAEVASPPVHIQQGAAARVVGYAAAARGLLLGLLPRNYRLEGYSTHLSVSLPGPPDAPFAERYARTFGPAFAALIDQPRSHGIYVRPRPGRLELCGEFVEGARLEAVAAFAAGSILAAREGNWPPELDLELLPCKERFGYRVHRWSPGIDLYAKGRSAQLPLLHSGSTTLAELLETTSDLIARAPDAEAFRQIVRGEQPLGIEDERRGEPVAWSAVETSPWGLATRTWHRGDRSITPCLATWDFTMFRVESTGNARVLRVPSRALDALARELSQDLTGVVDEVISTAAAPEPGPASPAVLLDLPPDTTALLPAELPVDGDGFGQKGKTRPTGRPGKASTSRIAKLVVTSPRTRPSSASGPPAPAPPAVPPPATEASPPAPPAPEAPPSAPLPPLVPPASSPPWGIIAGAVAAVIAIVGVIGVVLSQGGGEEPPATPTATSASATETVTEAPATPSPKPTETSPATPAATATAPSTETPPPATPTPTAAGAVATPTPDGGILLPTPTPTPPFTATATATATIRPTETPRPTNTPTPTPTQTPTPFIIAEPVPTAAPTLEPTPCVFIPGTTICR